MDVICPENALSIVPEPPPPGLFVTLGPEWLITWALEQITKTIVCPARVVWVDAANAFNAYIVAIAARTAAKDPTAVLRSYQVARPFTAFQLETMISEKTLRMAQASDVLLSVVADPLRLFVDAEGRDTQIQQCYRRFIRGLKKVAEQRPVLVLSPSEHLRYREPLLRAATRVTRLYYVDHQPMLALA